MMRHQVLVALSMLFLLAGCGMGEHQRIVVEDPWVREAPPGARALAVVCLYADSHLSFADDERLGRLYARLQRGAVSAVNRRAPVRGIERQVAEHQPAAASDIVRFIQQF